MNNSKIEIKKRAQLAMKTFFGFAPTLKEITLLEHSKASKHSPTEYIMIGVVNVEYQIYIKPNLIHINTYDSSFEVTGEVEYKYSDELEIERK